jgi:very-short-patch-repair endonuclease
MTGKVLKIAKNLRKRPTEAEQFLWKHLRARQLEGLKFRRQEPIDIYTADFVCYERRIVIEVDGGQHAPEKEKDTKRDKWLKAQGFKVLRFWNNEVLKNMDGVLEVIREKCLKHPTPPVKGGGLKGEKAGRRNLR